ncbi:MAG: hypothetical protein ACXACU_05210 [Candidatus Hodarchaeales archaeon]
MTQLSSTFTIENPMVTSTTTTTTSNGTSGWSIMLLILTFVAMLALRQRK